MFNKETTVCANVFRLNQAENEHVSITILAMRRLMWTLFKMKRVRFVIRLNMFRPSVNTALHTHADVISSSRDRLPGRRCVGTVDNGCVGTYKTITVLAINTQKFSVICFYLMIFKRAESVS